MAYACAVIAMATLTTCVIGQEENDVGLICWTCYNKSDNKQCNNWAPNLSCPPSQNVCKTVHRLNANGVSLLVNKRCVEPSRCTMKHVGCRSVFQPTDAVECTSCCDFPYCNEQVPTNSTEAFSQSTIASAACRTVPTLLHRVVLLCCVVIATVAGPPGVVM